MPSHALKRVAAAMSHTKEHKTKDVDKPTTGKEAVGWVVKVFW